MTSKKTADKTEFVCFYAEDLRCPASLYFKKQVVHVTKMNHNHIPYANDIVESPPKSLNRPRISPKKKEDDIITEALPEEP